jgi:hypothetical protein
MANLKVRKLLLISGLVWLLITSSSPQISLAASPLFFKPWQDGQDAQANSDSATATKQYEKAFQELQLNPWSVGMHLFTYIDQLTKFFIDSKNYDDAEQCLKFAIEIGGNYKFVQQLADLYKLEGKEELGKQTEADLHKWISENSENWNTTAAMRFQRFYCLANLQSAQLLKEQKLYEVTLDNGMVFDLPTNRVKWGNGSPRDPTLPTDVQVPPPDDMVQLANSKALAIVFRPIAGPLNEFDFCVAIAGRIYQATLTCDVHKQYLSVDQLQTAQDRSNYSPDAPIATIVRKEPDKIKGWSRLIFGRKPYWTPDRVSALKVSDPDADSLSEGERLLIFSRSNGGYLSFHILSLKSGKFIDQVRAVEAPYRLPMRAFLPWQRPKDYGLEMSLALESSALCTSTLKQGIDRSNGQDLEGENPDQLRKRTKRVICHATLANGMSFDLLVRHHEESPPREPINVGVIRPPRPGGTNEPAPTDLDPILAKDGSPVTVLVKDVHSRFPPNINPVVSVFVGKQLCEASPTVPLAKSHHNQVQELKGFKGMSFAEVQKIEAQEDGYSTVHFENGTSCSIDKDDAAKLKEGDTAVLFWQSASDGDHFKILTQAGIFTIEPPKNPKGASQTFPAAVPVVEEPGAWASRGWMWSLPGPKKIMVKVAYPVEVKQASAVATATADPTFNLPRWTSVFTWAMREIWWDLITHSDPKPFTLPDDLMKKSAVPRMPVLKSEPQPELPPTYVEGMAQVLVTIDRTGQTRKVTAKIFKSELNDTYNNVLLHSIEGNSQDAIFKLPDVRQFDHASFLIEFDPPKQATNPK